MQTAYLASIIIPVYNAASTLKKCVESIVFGSFRDIKVILVEDHSSDDSWTLCQRLQSQYKNVVCVQNETNSGVSHTRNTGLAFAEGEFVLFTDSDDWVSGKYAEKLIRAAREYKDAMPICGLHFHEDVAGYKSDYIWQPDGERTYLIPRTQLFDLAERFLLQQIWNKVFRRDVIETHHLRFDEKQSMGEDFQFVLDYLEAGGIENCLVLNETLYYYIRANSTSFFRKYPVLLSVISGCQPVIHYFFNKSQLFRFGPSAVMHCLINGILLGVINSFCILLSVRGIIFSHQSQHLFQPIIAILQLC